MEVWIQRTRADKARLIEDMALDGLQHIRCAEVGAVDWAGVNVQGVDREVVVVASVRTAVGDFGGSLKDFSPTQLGAMVVKEVVARAGVSADQVGHVVFGHVVNSEPRDMYLSRVAAIEGGLDKSTPALTLNRLCGSGLQAIVTAAQSIMLGDADVAIGGGAESMSKAPYILSAARWPGWT